MVNRRPGLASNSTSLIQSEVVDRFYGYLPDLLEALATTLNFQYDLYMVPDGSYGYRKGAERWSGMIGELLKGVSGMRSLLSNDCSSDMVEWETFSLTELYVLVPNAPDMGTFY